MGNALNTKTRIGEVTSNRMDKTVVVKTERKIPHPLFKKYVRRSKKYVAHDADNKCAIGDRVEIVETRPLSKTKRWKVISIISKAGGDNDSA